MINLTSQWQISPLALPEANSSGGMFVAGDKVVMVGGFNTAFAPNKDIWTTRIHGDNSLEAWKLAADLPIGLCYPVCGSNGDTEAFGGWLLFAGGSVDATTTGNVDTVYSLKVNGDGSVSIKTDHMPLGPISFGSGLLSSNGWFYYIGGATAASFQTKVWAAKIQGDGGLGAWKLVSPLPTALVAFSCVEINGNLVIAGGYDGAFTAHAEMYTAKINSDGSLMPWKYGGSLASTRILHAAAKFGDTMLIIGGCTDAAGATDITAMEMFRVDGSGNIFPQGVHPSPLPNGVQYVSCQALVKGGILYLLGGRDSPGGSNKTFIQTLQLKF